MSKDELVNKIADKLADIEPFRNKVERLLKDNIFEVACRNCGNKGDAKDFIASADFWADEDMAHVKYKVVTLRCPKCKVSEGLNKSPLW